MSDQANEPIVTKRTPEEEAERRTIVESTEFPANAFDEMMKRMSGSAAAGTEAKSFRYRELVLTIPLEGLRPETYDGPIKLTLRELSSEGEMRAFRAIGAKSDEGGLGAINQAETDPTGSGLMMAHAVAREAIHAVNGRVLVDNFEKDFAWNSMTMKARLAVAEAFFEAGAGEDVAGKILPSAEVS